MGLKKTSDSIIDPVVNNNLNISAKAEIEIYLILIHQLKLVAIDEANSRIFENILIKFSVAKS